MIISAIQCDENCAKYSPCVSTCPIETCENLLVQSPMNKLCKEDVCIEGCQPKLCPHDHVFLNSSLSECVPRNVCKPVCLQIDDVTYFEGDLIEEDACHTCFCSRGKKSCKGSPCTTTSVRISTNACVNYFDYWHLFRFLQPNQDN